MDGVASMRDGMVRGTWNDVENRGAEESHVVSQSARAPGRSHDASTRLAENLREQILNMLFCQPELATTDDRLFEEGPQFQ